VTLDVGSRTYQNHSIAIRIGEKCLLESVSGVFPAAEACLFSWGTVVNVALSAPYKNDLHIYNAFVGSSGQVQWISCLMKFPNKLNIERCAISLRPLSFLNINS